jgi:hypothetical protein
MKIQLLNKHNFIYLLYMYENYIYFCAYILFSIISRPLKYLLCHRDIHMHSVFHSKYLLPCTFTNPKKKYFFVYEFILSKVFYKT